MKSDDILAVPKQNLFKLHVRDFDFNKKKYGKAEYVQRRVCFVNVQSSLLENVVFFVRACMGNGQCHVNYIYHVEFHFRFGCLVSFPV